MKPSSPNPDTVRPARLDRPLGRATVPGYADPVIEALVSQAKERGRAEGRAAGFAAGWAEGRQRASAEVEAQRAQMTAQLDQDRRELAARTQALLSNLIAQTQRAQEAELPAWHDISAAMVAGVQDLVEALLMRELQAQEFDVLEAMRVAMHTLGDAQQVVMYAHPGDVALLTAHDLPPGTSVVADPTLEPGTVTAASGARRVEHHIPQAFARALEVLRG